MELPWRQVCLLLALLVMPVTYAAFCVGMSRHRQGRLISYLAYYFLFGFTAQWLLAVGMWPSGLSRTLLGFLLTAAPAACLGLALTLQKGPPRLPFDTGAMVGCYLYPVLVLAGMAAMRMGAGG